MANEMIKQACEYIRNTGGNATVAAFDDDHEPIGPMLRGDLMPRYAEVIDGKLVLTAEGAALCR